VVFAITKTVEYGSGLITAEFVPIDDADKVEYRKTF
jgi:hypothetical protein